MKKYGIYLLTAGAVLVLAGAFLKLEGWPHAGSVLGAALVAFAVGLILFVVATLERKPEREGTD
ncbi:MAG: hypothetical protein D6765_01495 [Bacteroidetes bacterium]|nr:MAG: hypothetical protein D6765_01495 [Bacteroidota bacterium]